MDRLLLNQLSSAAPGHVSTRALQEFTHETGWHPVFVAKGFRGSTIANNHIVVEHGLDHSAVLTFLRPEVRLQDLQPLHTRQLLNFSYNNLTDWHLATDELSVGYYNNRSSATDPTVIYGLKDVSSPLHISTLDEVKGLTSQPKVRALDHAFIQTIRYWKHRISASFANRVPNDTVARLFNEIIYLRAWEDHSKGNPDVPEKPLLRDLLLEPFWQNYGDLLDGYRDRTGITFPEQLLMPPRSQLNELQKSFVAEMILDFYSNRYCSPYEFDFSVISQQALSRLYERYITLLSPSNPDQPSLFPEENLEEGERIPGTVFTPQYIARFFAKYIYKYSTISTSPVARILDPACGSGIFLRECMEVFRQLSLESGLDEQLPVDYIGWDINQEACQASLLSLSLFSLAQETNIDFAIERTNSLADLLDANVRNFFDVIVANPPFIRYEQQSDFTRGLMGNYGNRLGPRADTYSAFLDGSVRALAEGGLLLMVLPHTFLSSRGGKDFKKELARICTVEALIDLSEVGVFEGVQVYPILLILRKSRQVTDCFTADIATRPGEALEYVLRRETVTKAEYRVDRRPQSAFEDGRWLAATAPPSNASSSRPESVALSDLFDIRQGVLAGLNPAFVLEPADVAPNEAKFFVKLLKDRDISPFCFNRDDCKLFFHPDLLGEDSIESAMPHYFEFLQQFREKLSARSGVSNERTAWWRPTRARELDFIKRPKLLTPHLMLTPKFSFDLEGGVAVIRSPMLALRDVVSETEAWFALATMNSTFFVQQLQSMSPKVNDRYIMVEVAALKECTFVLPASRPGVIDQIVAMAREIKDPYSPEGARLRLEIDREVSSLNGLERL